MANIYDVKGMSAARRWPGLTRTGALYQTRPTRRMIIPPGRQRLVEMVGKLLATVKCRSLDYAVTAPQLLPCTVSLTAKEH